MFVVDVSKNPIVHVTNRLPAFPESGGGAGAHHAFQVADAGQFYIQGRGELVQAKLKQIRSHYFLRSN